LPQWFAPGGINRGKLGRDRRTPMNVLHLFALGGITCGEFGCAGRPWNLSQ
jgi:hypothetical protein